MTNRYQGRKTRHSRRETRHIGNHQLFIGGLKTFLIFTGIRLKMYRRK